VEKIDLRSSANVAATWRPASVSSIFTIRDFAAFLGSLWFCCGLVEMLPCFFVHGQRVKVFSYVDGPV
jgi:hypothetical protein